MNAFKYLVLTLSFSLFSLIACQELALVPDNESKFDLNQLEEFKAYIQARENARQEVREQAQSLNPSERNWLQNFQLQYPSPQIALAEAIQIDLDRYQSLSGQNLSLLEEESSFHFGQLIQKLKEMGVLDPMELGEQLFPYPENMEEVKFNMTCTQTCEFKSKKLQREIYNSCMEGNDSPQACAEDAEIHFRYFMNDCLQGCD